MNQHQCQHHILAYAGRIQAQLDAENEAIAKAVAAGEVGKNYWCHAYQLREQLRACGRLFGVLEELRTDRLAEGLLSTAQSLSAGATDSANKNRTHLAEGGSANKNESEQC